MVKGQRDTCSHRDVTCPNVQKLSYADAPNDASPGNVVAKTQTRTAQNRAIAEPTTCLNNKRLRGCEEKMSKVVLVSCTKLKCVCKYNNCGRVTRC